jgi:hypothetical protein
LYDGECLAVYNEGQGISPAEGGGGSSHALLDRRGREWRGCMSPDLDGMTELHSQGVYRINR